MQLSKKINVTCPRGPNRVICENRGAQILLVVRNIRVGSEPNSVETLACSQHRRCQGKGIIGDDIRGNSVQTANSGVASSS